MSLLSYGKDPCILHKPLNFKIWKRMQSGDCPGLQNRRAASCDVAGGFDPHSLPPMFS